jgi:hypothetical protein
LAALGYVLTIRERSWYEHRMLRHDRPRINLHVFGRNCAEHARHILFRDCLRAHPEDCAQYTRVKGEARIGVTDVRVTTTITERLFDAHTKRQPHEPSIALCGLDNAAGRRELDRAGFDFVAEAGLGRGHADFRSMLIRTLPGAVPAAKLWEAATADTTDGPADAAAYRKLLEEGSLDRCGVALLAGKAVGAPFVGAVAATIVVAEVLRLLHGAPVNRLIDLNLVDPDHRRIAPQVNDFSALNPGYVPLQGD